MSGQLLSEIGVAYFADMSGLEKAATQADKVTQMIGASAEKSAGVMSSAFESATKSTQDLMQRAEEAGLNVSKLANFQAKAGEAAARLDVAQASAAIALQKADDMALSGSASAEQIALAQAKAALAAERVNTTEIAAGLAMQKASEEADRLAAELEAQSAKVPILIRAYNLAKGALDTMSPSFQSVSQAANSFADKVSVVSTAVSSRLKVAEDSVQEFSSKLSTDAVSAADEFSAKIASVGARVGASISGMADRTGAAFSAFGARIGAILADLGAKAVSASQPVVSLGSKVEAVFSSVSSAVASRMQAASEAVQSFATRISTGVSSAVSAFQARLMAALQPAIDFGTRVGDAIGNMASNVQARLSSAASAVASFGSRIGTQAANVASRVGSGFGQAGLILLGFGIKAGQGLGQASDAFLRMTGLEPVVSAFSERVQSTIDSMIGNIKERFASLRGPIAQFGQRIAESSPSVASFGSSVKASFAGMVEKAGQIPGAVSGAVGSLMSGFKNAAGSVLDFTSKVGMAVFGVKQLAQSAIALATGLFQPAATAEQTAKSLEVLMGSAGAAKKEMQDLNTFAAQTPFQTQDIDNAAQKMLSVGINAKDVIPDIRALGDGLAAMSKTSGADLDMIVSNFDKIKTSGHLTGDVMQSFADAGIDAWSIMEKQTGKTHDQLESMISGGLIPADQAMKQLTEGIEANPLYGGQMANAASTFNGLMSTLASLWNQGMAALAGPTMQLAETGLTNLSNSLSSPAFTNFASGAGQQIANAFQSISNFVVTNDIGGKILLLGQNLSNFFNNPNMQIFAKTVGQDLVTGFNNFMTAVSSPAFGKFMGDVGSFAGGALTNLWNMLKNVVGAAQATAEFFQKNQVAMDLLIGVLSAAAIIIGVALVAAFIGWAIAAGAAAIATLMATWPILLIGAIIALVVAGIILAIQHWGDIVNWLKGVWSGLSNFFGGIMNGIVGAFKTGINWLIDQINGFISGINSINVVGFSVHIPLIPHLAKGTDNFMGGMALVGENGPELVNLPRGAGVFDNRKTESFLSAMKSPMSASPVSASPISATPASGGSTVYVTVHVEPPSVTLDKHELVDQIGEGVTRTLISQTGVK